MKDAAGGKVDVACGFDAGETLVVSEVKAGFLSVVGDVTFAVLIGVERSRVEVDIGVELLDGNVETASLKQFADW